MAATKLKVGGQALPDGVLMRTERAWAVARADGTVEVGPLPPARFVTVPVLRVIAGLGTAMSLAVRKGFRGGSSAGGQGRSARRRLVAVMLLGEVLVLGATSVTAGLHLPGWLRMVTDELTPLVLMLAILRVASPGPLWRYHGAEHKAVAAYEAGVDLSDTDAVLACPRVHDRCGTNLVVWVGFISPTLALGGVPAWARFPFFIVGLAAVAEVVSLCARNRHWPLATLVLGPGRWLQAVVTTREPLPAEQVVGASALEACLVEHARVVSEESRLAAPAALVSVLAGPAAGAGARTPALALD